MTMPRMPWTPYLYLTLRRWSGDKWLHEARAHALIPRPRRG
jgi:hypothetical protein